MILADTSAWIDYFADKDSYARRHLRLALVDDDLVIGDLVLVEILQGIRSDRQLRETSGTLGHFKFVSLCGPQIAKAAASNFRLLRSRGITIRGTIDVIIATWCVENDAEIIHNDRDFAAMERLLGLRRYRPD